MAMYSRPLFFSTFPLLAVLLTGCGSGVLSGPSTVHGSSLKGVVHGGQNPVSGAQVYLYAAGTAGYGAAASSILQASSTPGSSTTMDSNGNYYVTTDAGGNFSITGDYSCGTSPVYLYAVGGNPGSGTNSALGLLAGLGDCNSVASSGGSVVVNEVTTIATAFALAGYSTDSTHIASSSTTLSKTGLTNAFANIGNLISLSGGSAYSTTPAGNGTVPQATINTLANILAACVNSVDTKDGGGNFVSYSSNCSTLFANATSNGTYNSGTQPSDTATAAINIAHFPGSNMGNLYGLPTGIPPFAPALTGSNPPIDFILGIQYTGTGLNNPGGIAIDAAGNAWITNYSGNTVTELTSLGAAAPGSPFTDSNFNNPAGIAIDTTGNVWVANFNGADATEISSNGSSFTDVGLGLGSASGGTAIAIDTQNNPWLTSPTTNNVVKITPALPSGFTVSTYSPTASGRPDFAGPTGIAIDPSSNVWITDSGANNLFELNSSGALVTGETSAGFTGAGLSTPFSVAIDSSGNIWATDPSNAVSKLTSSGSIPVGETSSGYTGGALNNPEGVAIDGAGSVWVADEFSSKNITVFTNAGALATGESSTEGYVGGGLTFPAGIAVDGSGNVWVTNSSQSGVSTSVTELIGVATPVVTPIAASLVSPYSAPASLP